jgi:regulator of protease activity HflC (stomatin/prohibitin superfamily)
MFQKTFLRANTRQTFNNIVRLSSSYSSGRFPSKFNTMVNFLPQGYEYVIERFGKLHSVEPSGLLVLVPFVDKIKYAVDMRELCLRISPEQAFTQDNVSVTLGGNLYLQFIDSKKAVYGVDKPIYAIKQFAQSIMRTQVGKLELNELFRSRSIINDSVVKFMTSGANEWGCSLKRFEITDLEPSDRSVADSLHKQATAEREKLETVLRAEAKRIEVENESDAFFYRQQKESDAYRYKQEQEGHGQAQKILLKAEAEKKSITLIAEAMDESESSEEAIKMRLSYEYLSQFGNLAKENNTMIIPSNLTDVASMLSAGSKILK